MRWTSNNLFFSVVLWWIEFGRILLNMTRVIEKSDPEQESEKCEINPELGKIGDEAGAFIKSVAMDNDGPNCNRSRSSSKSTPIAGNE